MEFNGSILEFVKKKNVVGIFKIRPWSCAELLLMDVYMFHVRKKYYI
jgi:hypothetical protein